MELISVLAPIIFMIAFVVLAVQAARALFTKKGKQRLLEQVVNGKIDQDYGLISERSDIGQGIHITQKLHFFKCRADDEEFYVIEVTETGPGSLKRHWVKLDLETIKKIEKIALKHQKVQPMAEEEKYELQKNKF